MNPSQRLAQQVAFIAEIDKLKHVQRQTILLDRSRRENDAEHSWHLAMMVLLLAEHSDQPIDSLRVLKMVLIHDLVEIDAGDTYAYDEEAHHDKALREQAAADRLRRGVPGAHVPPSALRCGRPEPPARPSRLRPRAGRRLPARAIEASAAPPPCRRQR